MIFRDLGLGELGIIVEKVGRLFVNRREIKCIWIFIQCYIFATRLFKQNLSRNEKTLIGAVSFCGNVVLEYC